jgi:ribosome maturation factor RimP
MDTLTQLRDHNEPISVARATMSLECRINPVGESPLFCWFKLKGTMQSAIASKIEEIAQRVAQSEGMEIVEVEVKGGGAHGFVRISIDKPEGVTHGDCELISQQVGTILDVEDVVPGGHYTLEVSSPGIERKLVKLRDYERFQGKKAKIVLKEPIDQKRTFEGALAGVAGSEIALEIAPGQTVRVPFDQVQKANLKFEW